MNLWRVSFVCCSRSSASSSKWKHAHLIDDSMMWFWVSKTHTCLDTHRQNVLMVTLRHNCKLFWVRHTKGTHTSWQAVYSPQIRPLWPCQYLFRCCDCSRVSLGVGFTLPVRELEVMGERPRSARGIHLRSTPLLTVLNLVIKSDAKPVMFYENWQDMLTVSSVVSNISSKLWGEKTSSWKRWKRMSDDESLKIKGQILWKISNQIGETWVTLGLLYLWLNGRQ